LFITSFTPGTVSPELPPVRLSQRARISSTMKPNASVAIAR